MARFILIKRKGSKHWTGAIPVKKGVSSKQLRKSLSKALRSGLMYRVTDSAGVKRAALSSPLKRKKKRR